MAHKQKKDEARDAMNADIANPDIQFVFTLDLEAVLVCPVTKASAGYYKSKLIVDNYTLYDCRTQRGYCYLWDKTEGDLQSSVFATLLTKFLKEEVPFKVGDVIVLWSDGCGYQNRNEIVANEMVNFALEQQIIIRQRYLEKEHTQMKCDAMHSKIERKCRGKEIYQVPTSHFVKRLARNQNLSKYVIWITLIF